ncbi:MAG: GGDEF domain-containing protein [Clostridia bacterium]|jgi:diguanylate cyclase (GGDEF)-like protein|nr:GGDEF domain-containing protein [Clostridia bacterium]MDD4275771.1 GGDEF domain-containing protein [Clostridia bacterium]
MDNFITFNATNFFSLFILAIIYFDCKLNSRKSNELHNKLFSSALICVIIAQVLDILCWFLIGQTGLFITIISYIANILLFTFAALLTAKIATFVQYSADFDEKEYKNIRNISCLSTGFVLLLSISSVWLGWIFKLDANNNYSRGNLYFLIVIGVLFPLIYVCFNLIRKHLKSFNIVARSNKLLALLIIINIIFPVLFVFLQGKGITNFATLYPFIAISLLLLHLMIMSSNAGTDFLTGIQNNYGIQKYFSIFPKSISSYFAIIYFDLNDFKSINDIYGHKEGDEVLKAFAHILAREIKSSDLVARPGGDEFIIGAILKAPEEIKYIINNIQTDIDAHNQMLKNYKISFSYGVCINEPHKTIDKDFMIRDADKKMYKNKPTSKQMKIDLN